MTCSLLQRFDLVREAGIRVTESVRREGDVRGVGVEGKVRGAGTQCDVKLAGVDVEREEQGVGPERNMQGVGGERDVQCACGERRTAWKVWWERGSDGDIYKAHVEGRRRDQTSVAGQCGGNRLVGLPKEW